MAIGDILNDQEDYCRKAGIKPPLLEIEITLQLCVGDWDMINRTYLTSLSSVGRQFPIALSAAES